MMTGLRFRTAARRVGALIVLCALAAAPVAALDWGGSISTTNSFDGEDLSNSQRLQLYLNYGLGAQWSFVGQAGAVISPTDDVLFAADIEKLYFQRDRVFTEDAAQPLGLIGLTTRYGRYTVSEPTGLVMSHDIDGVGVRIAYRSFDLALDAGYTGLLNKEFSRLNMSLRDSADATDSDVYFGPPRFLGQVRAAMPELVLGQNLSVALVVQEDLRDPTAVVQTGQEPADIVDAGGLLDTQYAILQVDGPVRPVAGLFYSAAYVLNTGRMLSAVDDDAALTGTSYQYQPILAHMASGTVRYFLANFFSSVASATVTFASGDSDFETFAEGNTAGNATMFTAVTPGSSGIVFGMQPGNSLVTELSYALQPLSGGSIAALRTLQPELRVLSFFRPSGEGAVSVSDVDAATSGAYLGTEVDVAVRLRPFSDLGVGVSAGFLFANEDVLVASADAFQYVVRLDASLSF